MLQFYANQLKRHIENMSLDLVVSETVRNQLRDLINGLMGELGEIQNDAVSSSEISEETAESVEETAESVEETTESVEETTESV
jgi:methyl-accepting chemotaxis protein